MLIEAYVYERKLHTFFKINLFKLQKLKKVSMKVTIGSLGYLSLLY